MVYNCPGIWSRLFRDFLSILGARVDIIDGGLSKKFPYWGW